MRLGVPKRHRHRVVAPVGVRPFWPGRAAPRLDHVEVQMRRGAVTRVAAQADSLTLRDRLAVLDPDTAVRQVEVPPDGSVVVLGEHVILVAERVVRVRPLGFGFDHAAGARGDDIARHFELQWLMIWRAHDDCPPQPPLTIPTAISANTRRDITASVAR